MDDPTRLFRLDGRSVIVTGASSGLGAKMAEIMAAAGARVALAARRMEKLERLVADITDDGGEAIAVACDVTREADVDRLIATVVDRYGTVDVLVNNAGIADPQPAEAESLEHFKHILDVNLNSVFLCSQRCSRVMLAANGGAIVNIASILGVVGAGQVPQASYTASKGGVVNMTRKLAAQWARRGIRVNAILPGWFPSEMTQEMFADDGSVRWIRGRTPMGRGGDPTELGGALLFLASEASSYVTGATLAVDGGWTTV